MCRQDLSEESKCGGGPADESSGIAGEDSERSHVS